MLKYANGSIDRAIVLVSASSGIRVGGFDLNWQDIIPIYQVDEQLKFEITESEDAEIACAMLRIYQGTGFSYPAFITPEAYEALMDYKLDWTREIRREPKPEDPIFKKEGSILRRSTPIGVKKRVERMIKRAGLRDKIKGKRYEVPIMNGFRRFWNKTCKESLSRDSPLGSLIKKEFMMGHTGLIKLDRNYFKTHTLELAEEYLNAIPNLTISNEKHLRLENRKKTEKIEKLEKQQREIDNLKLEVKRIDMKNKVDEAIERKFIKWAEENPDKADALQIAKTGLGHISHWDETIEHYLMEHDGDISGFLERISKAEISLKDD